MKISVENGNIKEPRPLWRPVMLACLTATTMLTLTGCSGLGYYHQAIQGHLHLMQQRRPIEDVIEDPKVSQETREKLLEVMEITAFAHEELGLPDNGSYRYYADTGRSYITWNVFAAPELSLTPKRWCYLVVGCMEYRGYYSEPEARDYAEKLRQSGWEVYVGGARAYSTLGWFRDPVLNTILELEHWQLARIIFHELAHQVLYLDDCTATNEAFAETVARIGLERWLKTRHDTEMAVARTALEREDSLFSMLLGFREQLASLYASEFSREEKLRMKQQLFAGIHESYQELKREWSGDTRYDGWLNRSDLNNAQLVAISTYRRLLPRFMELFEASGGDLPTFYSRIESARECVSFTH